MPRFENPTVLVTRPKASSLRFVAVLKDQAGPFRPVIYPAFENVPTGAFVGNFDSAIFTSRAGVDYAPNGQGRRAYCVGHATANAAQDAGFDAISADGAADDLVKMILADKPRETLAHLRGETSIGNITKRLQQHGIICDDVIIYRKDPMPPTVQILQDIETAETLLIPLFSAETVSILSRWKADFSKAHIIALSDAIAEASGCLSAATIAVSDHSDLSSIAQKTAAMIA